MGKLDGAVAVISGGARGMGAEHARRFVAEGARVVLGDILDDEGRALAEELGEAARYVSLDVTKSDDWAAAVSLAERDFGSITVLVNNAGINHWGTIDETSEADYRKVVDINQVGTFLGMKAVAPSMKAAGGGSIVNVSSTGGMMGLPGIIGYVASKWAVRGMTKAAAVEWGGDGIRVNSIHPGQVRTPMTEMLDDDGLTGLPVPRKGEPAEVSTLVVYLASTDSAFTTGAEHVIDGGQILL